MQISRRTAAHIVVDKGDVVAVALGLDLEALQHRREILVAQTASPLVYKQDAQMVGAVGFQCPCRGIGQIAQLIRYGTNPATGLLADVRLTVQRLADGGNRHAASPGDVLHGNHGANAPFSCQNFLIVFVASIYSMLHEKARYNFYKKCILPNIWRSCTFHLRKTVNVAYEILRKSEGSVISPNIFS